MAGVFPIYLGSQGWLFSCRKGSGGAASRIQGITVEIGGDTMKLSAAYAGYQWDEGKAGFAEAGG